MKKTLILKSIENYLNYHPPAKQLFNELYEIGELYLIGGVLREFIDVGDIKNLRDIDIVINTKNVNKFNEICLKYHAKKNSFDGYKMICTDLVVDVWRIEQTWAYREKIIICCEKDYLKNLTKTVFYNMDSIVYDIKEDKWYDSIYKEAKENNILDIVLEENPHIDLNILRGMILQSTYDMQYSVKVKNIIRDRYQEENDYDKLLYDIEIRRYKREILSLNDIKNQLYKILIEK